MYNLLPILYNEIPTNGKLLYNSIIFLGIIICWYKLFCIRLYYEIPTK